MCLSVSIYLFQRTVILLPVWKKTFQPDQPKRKPLMNGFPPVGYPAMPQFSNFFSMHHLMQPMAMASHIGLRPDAGVPKLERSTTDSGIISP
ncbi:dachshund 1, partial [Biomphalaria glabrata]